MTTEEKAAAFELLVSALVNRWHDGRYSAHCASMVECPFRASAEECVPDIIAWAEKVAPDRAKRRAGL